MGGILGRLRVSGANGCEEGDDGNARCQRKIKNAYFRGSLRWIMSHEWDFMWGIGNVAK
jgi:hypothetical protein